MLDIAFRTLIASNFEGFLLIKLNKMMSNNTLTNSSLPVKSEIISLEIAKELIEFLYLTPASITINANGSIKIINSVKSNNFTELPSITKMHTSKLSESAKKWMTPDDFNFPRTTQGI